MPNYKGTDYTLKERYEKVQVDFRFDGKRYRKSCATAGEAEVWMQNIVDRKADGLPAEKPKREDFKNPTLQHVFDVLWAEEWKGTRGGATSKKNAEDCVKELGTDTRIRDVTTQTIDSLIATFKDAEMTPGTIRRKLAALSRLLHFSMEKGWLEAMPLINRKKAGKERERDRYVTPDEERAGLTYLKSLGYNDEFFAFLIDTGLRLSAAVELEWDKVDWSADGKTAETIRVDDKTDMKRSVPCTLRVQEMLSARRAAKSVRERRVWHDMTPNKAQYQFGLWREKLFGKEDDKDYDAKGAKDFCIHALRHTTATRLCRAGVPLNVVKAIMGWKSTAMVMRYAHECPDGKREAMQAMQSRFTRPALKIG